MLGAICGDILGSGYEFEDKKYYDISEITLCRSTDIFTDDTAMTLAVAEWLMYDINTAYYDDDKLKIMLAKRFIDYACHKYRKYHIGYGGNFWQWCCKGDLIQEYEPINSYGNGAGMRVSPVGWYFDTLEETLRFAKLSADVTHNHPEGQKGAMCIAAAVFLARKGETKDKICEYLLRAFGYASLKKTASQWLRECGWSEICQDTVPMSVAAFLESDSYESAVRWAISYGSDSDTIADMAGAIAEAYYGEVPAYLESFCKSKLPDDALSLIDEFYKKVKQRGS